VCQLTYTGVTMTDHDTDDFEFDEDGIYREKHHFCGSQPG